MNRQKVLYEGILVGLAGAAAVAVWFLMLDLVAGAPLRTPALLGAVLFDGLRDPAALTITPGIVLKYTAVHGLAFLIFGLAIAGLFALAERERHLLFGVFRLFCCFEVAVFAAMMILGSWLLDTLQPWAILGGNLVAALVMLALLFPRPPFLAPRAPNRGRVSGFSTPVARPRYRSFSRCGLTAR